LVRRYGMLKQETSATIKYGVDDVIEILDRAALGSLPSPAPPKQE